MLRSRSDGKAAGPVSTRRVQGVHRHHIDRFGATGVTSRSMHSPARLTAVRRNGEQFPIEATISQIGEGVQKRYTVILRDITQRKQTERALVHSEKLASLGRLSAAVAHEVNNPLEGAEEPVVRDREQSVRQPKRSAIMQRWRMQRLLASPTSRGKFLGCQEAGTGTQPSVPPKFWRRCCRL